MAEYLCMQSAIYWLRPPNTRIKQIRLKICGNKGVCRIA